MTTREKISVALRRPKTKRNNSGQELFALHCRAHKLPQPIAKETTGKQFTLLNRVQTPRRDGKNIPNVWRWDFAWPTFGVIVEIDGGVWMPGGGAHSHPVDITRNMAKRNDAALAGFFVLSFTPQQVKGGHAIDDTMRMLATRGWQR